MAESTHPTKQKRLFVLKDFYALRVYKIAEEEGPHAFAHTMFLP